MATTVNLRVRVAVVWAGLALFAAGCGQAVAKVEARGEPARNTDAAADVAESGTSPQIGSGIGVEVCAPADISVPTTTGRPPAQQADQAPATADAEMIRAAEADFARLGALGLGRIALCSGATGYIELAGNDAGCFTVFSDPERSRTLGQQRARASLQVLHPMGSGC